MKNQVNIPSKYYVFALVLNLSVEIFSYQIGKSDWLHTYTDVFYSPNYLLIYLINIIKLNKLYNYYTVHIEIQ